MHEKAYQIASLFSDREHPYTTSAKEQDGCVQKNGIFC